MYDKQIEVLLRSNTTFALLAAFRKLDTTTLNEVDNVLKHNPDVRDNIYRAKVAFMETDDRVTWQGFISFKELERDEKITWQICNN